ncbi:MAG: hypothetical protein IKK30_05925 [Clostridia bacterium]|nr:hypothetical protein [Clostridia bacterium]
MLWVIFWVLVSFFAVVGLMETLLFLLEIIALRRISSIRKVSLRVELSGNAENTEYILNTLLLMLNRVDIGDEEATLEISDGGISDRMRVDIMEYCEKNPWVRFTYDQ